MLRPLKKQLLQRARLRHDDRHGIVEYLDALNIAKKTGDASEREEFIR